MAAGRSVLVSADLGKNHQTLFLSLTTDFLFLGKKEGEISWPSSVAAYREGKQPHVASSRERNNRERKKEKEREIRERERERGRERERERDWRGDICVTRLLFTFTSLA